MKTRGTTRGETAVSKKETLTGTDETNDRLQPEHYPYNLHSDTRYSYPPPPSSRDKSRSRKPARHESRQWPPPPKVEEEKIALAREFEPLETSSDDETPSRGTIDQDPIIQDVPEFIHDRRFVLLPSDGKTITTPPTSDDERKRRGRRKVPKLETEGLPEIRREASPYAWTKPTPSTTTHRSSGDFFLSPDTITPSAKPRFTDIPKAVFRDSPTSAPTIAPTSAPLTTATHASAAVTAIPSRRSSPYAQAGATSSEEDYSRNKTTDTRTRPSHSRRTSYARSDINVRPSPPAVEYASPPHASRIHPDSSPRASQHDLPQRNSKPVPFKATSLHDTRHSHHSRHHSDGHSSHDSHQVYEAFPRRISSRYPPSPPRSPMPGVDRPSIPLPSLPNSRPSSQAGSLHSSPLPSPHITKSSMVGDALWGSFAASAAAKHASRLSSTTLSGSTSRPHSSHSSHSGHTVIHSASGLPYPDDDATFETMPSERDHQFTHPHQRGNLQPPFEESKPASRAATPSTSFPTPVRRPPLSARNSGSDDLPVLPNTPRSTRRISPDIVKAPKTASQLKALSRPLPPCSRQKYSSDYDDWYGIDGCPGFDMCPDCLDLVFEDTVYRPYFSRAPNRASLGKRLQVKCDFADAWVRLGWLLTVQREMPSLDLIKALINLSPPSDSNEACPGSSKAIRDWYSIRDRDGHFLRGFIVCSADVRKLRVLFPGFRELWQPLPMRISYSYADDFGGLSRRCSLRPALNSRYPLYIDTLVRLHEPSYQAGRMPDASQFVSLVRRKNSIPECPRDDMVRGEVWHFIPSLLPAFTVCEDCYDEVISPVVDADADVAMRFNREAQPVPADKEGYLGSSCQLYSARMRRIFQRAVEDNDLRYLLHKTVERKDTEDRLQDQVKEIEWEKRRLKASAGDYGLSTAALTEMRRMNKELEHLSDRWAQWE